MITDSPAVFKLYNPVQTGETGTTVEGVGNGYVEVATLTTNSGFANLAAAIQELRKLPDDQHYYLVETQEPSGYVKLTSPIQIDVTVTAGNETKPYEATEGITDLINIGKETPPTAVIAVTDSGAEVLADNNGMFVLKIINRPGSADIMIHKVNDHNEPLPGAVFKLTNGTAIVNIASEGTGVVVEPKAAGQTVTIEDNTFTIPEGSVTIRNLPASEDTYSIVEVSSPAGYVLTNNTPVTFKVTAGNITDENHIEGVTYTSTNNDFIIPNEPGAALPNTGGLGTNRLYLFGFILTGLAGAGFVMKGRRRNAA